MDHADGAGAFADRGRDALAGPAAHVARGKDPWDAGLEEVWVSLERPTPRPPVDALDQLAEALDGEALSVILPWLVAGCATYQLASEIEAAASRIHNLVAAVKGFTYMDQATMPKPVDVGQGLADTLAVLNAKARGKQVGVSLEVEADLPRIQGFGGELNQVWANLVDNALDAARGHVGVAAVRQGHSVVVRVVDDGPGLPPEIRERIFDPFFTTKPVGQGTGLGLDIARRLVLAPAAKPSRPPGS